jgi:hypothetical protein
MSCGKMADRSTNKYTVKQAVCFHLSGLPSAHDIAEITNKYTVKQAVCFHLSPFAQEIAEITCGLFNVS